MIEIKNKNECCGCHACYNICPKGAITMQEDEEGFKYPVIDQNKCIDCELCKKTCPELSTNKNAAINDCYVGYNKDETEILSGSSGSIFSIIANYVIENNGIVIGAAFDKNKLKHIAVDKKEDLVALKKSKYVQSDLGWIFSYVKEQVESRLVLFVGTPCQVAGLKAFLKKDYDKLICIDIVCHGVPSPKLLDKYFKELELANDDSLLNYDFRDKETGWDTYSYTATFKNKKITQRAADNDYSKLFLADVALRKSCYNCNFKLGNKYSDITLGDFWGVQNFYPEMYNKKGVSAIIVNTEKGAKAFDLIKDKINYKSCKLDEILLNNPSLEKSCLKPEKRENFFKEIDNCDISTLVKKYVPRPSFVTQIKRIIKHIINY